MSVVDVAGHLYLLLAVLGLAVSVQYAGMPVLGQSAFVAVGGFGTLQLAEHGLPLLAAVAGSVGAGAVGGYLLGAGTARLHGAALALGTWVLAWFAAAVLIAFPDVSGGAQGLTQSAPARVVSPSLGVSVTVTPAVHLVTGAVLCALTLVALWRMTDGPVGTDLDAVRSSPALAASLGVRVGPRRRQALAVTGALGALGGAGGAVLLGSVAPADVSPLLALQLLVAVLLAGTWRPWGAVPGYAVVAVVPEVADLLAEAFDASPEHVRGALTAGLLVGVLVLRGPVLRWAGGRRWWGRGREPGARSSAAVPLRHAPETLAVRDLRLSFGGVRALDGVDLEVRPGEVHAVIGPNGSGKSTLLRVVSGALPADSGSVVLGDETLVGGQAERVRRGVVRTTQRAVVPTDLSWLAQTATGAGATLEVVGAGLRHLLATPRGRRVADDQRSRAVSAMRAAGLLSGTTGPTDTGAQRMLQVARALATGARVLLLDEPAAGMTPAERAHLAAVVRDVAGNGCAVCVVEHDMRFVAAVSDRVTVLHAGRVVATGTPDSVRADPEVRRVYLGEEHVA